MAATDPRVPLPVGSRLVAAAAGVELIDVAAPSTEVDGYDGSVGFDGFVVVAARPNAVRAARACFPRATLVAVVVALEVAAVTRLLDAGVNAVLDLAASDAELAHGLERARVDGAYVPPAVQCAAAAAVVRARRDDPVRRARVARLTEPERTTLLLLGAGADRGAVARHLGVPVSLVRTRVDRAKAKLGVRTQREAVAMVGTPVSAESRSGAAPGSAT